MVFGGGYFVGIFCVIVFYFVDVMVSKLNFVWVLGEVFGGVLSCIYKEIGFGGFWNGLLVRIVMIGMLIGF